MRIRRWALRTGGALMAAVVLAAFADAVTYDAAAWRSDFERLKSDMAQGYANLDWIAERRRLDLAALARETEAEIDGAGSHLVAFRALNRFIDRFDDPHLQLSERAPGSGPPTEGRPADCAAAGYGEGRHGFRFPVERLPGWRTLAEGNFPTGMTGTTGILRIAEFGENQYLSACTAAFRAGMSERALQLAVRRSLQAELGARLAQLRRSGAKRLIVDLSRNGGGSEWVGEAVPLFTGRRLERPSPAGSVPPATVAASGKEGGPPAPSSPRRIRRCGSPARGRGRGRCWSWPTATRPPRPRTSSPG